MAGNNNDVVLPISFPVDTGRLADDIHLAQTIIDQLQGQNIPLFPDQSAALGKFTLKIKQVKSLHDSIASSMMKSNKAMTDSAFAAHAQLVRTAQKSAEVAQGISAANNAAAKAIEDAARRSLSASRRVGGTVSAGARKAGPAPRGAGETHTQAGDAARRIVEEARAKRDAVIQSAKAETAALANEQAKRKATEDKALAAFTAATKRRQAQVDRFIEKKREELSATKGTLAEEQALLVAAASREARAKAELADKVAATAAKRAEQTKAALDKELAAGTKASQELARRKHDEAKIFAASSKHEAKAAHDVANAITKQSKAVEKITLKTRAFAKADAVAIKGLTRFSRIVAVIQGPLGPFAGRLTAAASAVRTMGVKMLGIGLGIGAFKAGVERAIPAAIELQRVMATLSAATGDADASFALVVSEVRRTGANLDGLASSYAQLAAAARGTALEGDAIKKIFHGINTASLALRLDIHQTSGAIKAMEQMISKGTVASEEMRQQLGERLPGAFRLAADSVGMTTREFSKALAQGKILAEDLLPKLAKSLEENYGRAAQSASGKLGVALEKLNQEVDVFFGTLIRPSLLDAFSSSIERMTSLLQSLEEHLAGVNGQRDGLVELLSNLVSIAEAYGAFKIIKYISKLREAATATAGVGAVAAASAGSIKSFGSKIANVAKSAAKATGPFIRSFGSMSGAVRSLGLLLGGLASLVSLPITAIAAATAAAAAGIGVYFDRQNANLNAKIKRDQAKFDKATQAMLDKEQLRVKELSRLSDEALARGDKAQAESLRKRSELLAAHVKKQAGLYARRLKLDLRSHNIIVERSAAEAKVLDKMDDALLKKRLTRMERFRQATVVHLKSLHHARVRFSDELTKLEDKAATHVLTKKEEIRRKELVERLKLNKESITLFAKNYAEFSVLVDKEHAKKKSKEEKAAAAERKRIAALARARSASVTKQSADLIKLSKQQKLYTLEKGTRERMLARQEIARDDLVTKHKLALIKATTEEARRAANARFGVESAKLREQQKNERDAFNENVSRLKGNGKLIELAAARTEQQAKAVSQRLARQREAQNPFMPHFGGSADALKQAEASSAKLIDIKRQEINKQFELAKIGMDKGLELDNLIAQHRVDLQQNEIDLAQSHADTLVAIEQDRFTRMSALQTSFATLAQGDQQTNLSSLADGLLAFGEQYKSIQDTQAQLDKKRSTMSAKDIKKIEKEQWDAKLSLASAGLHAVSGLMQSHNRRTFELGKAAAVAGAIVDTFTAVNKALASAPPPLNFALAAIVGAAGIANVVKISQTKMGSTSAGSASTPSGSAASAGYARAPTRIPFNPNQPPQSPTTPVYGTAAGNVVNITQHITAPNAQIGSAQAIQTAAAAGAQQALAAVGQDFATNGPLRQTLAV